MEALEIPRTFGPAAFTSWTARWTPASRRADLRLTLPAGTALEPAGIVLLASGIAARQANGLKTWLVAEDSDDLAVRRLRELDFLAELGVENSDSGAAAASSTAAPPSSGGVRLRRLSDLKSVRKLADRTRDFLESTFPALSPTTLRAAHFVFEELGANVVQHSARPDTGFGVAAADARTGRIQVAFADAGVGFLASLQRNPELAGRIADDAQAIQLALDRRITGGGPGNRGIGLSFLAALSADLEGDLWIASGTALVRRGPPRAGAGGASVEAATGWRGAWICLDAPVPGWRAEVA